MTMEQPGLYLYCVVPGERNEDLDLKGIDGARVYTTASDGISAVVQQTEQKFDEKDEKRLTEWVLTHQAVVDCAWERYETVVPFGFGTIVVAKEGKPTTENLLEWLKGESASLKEKLKRLEGKAEYGVQISWDPTVLKPKIIRNDREILDLEQEIQSKPKGTAYLLNQKLDGLYKKRLEGAADAYFKEFYQKIRAAVEEIHVEKVRKEEPPRQMLANLSCLTGKKDTSALSAELDKLNKLGGFYVHFTGPWPPYSFV